MPQTNYEGMVRQKQLFFLNRKHDRCMQKNIYIENCFNTTINQLDGKHIPIQSLL